MTPRGERGRGVLRTLRSDVRFCGRHLLFNVIAGSAVVPRPLRSRLYRRLGLSVGSSNFYPHIRFLLSGDGRLVIGDRCMVNEGVVIDRSANITIGDGAAVGPDVLFCTSSHALGDSRQRAAAVVSAPIAVGAGAWIGARAILLPGAEVGPGAVVAAGAVVTGRCAADGLYAGVPARRIKDLAPDESPALAGWLHNR